MRRPRTRAPDARGSESSSTPTLGLFRATIGVHGDVMVPEDRLKTAVVQAATTGEPLADEIARLIGQPWDEASSPIGARTRAPACGCCTRWSRGGCSRAGRGRLGCPG